MKAFSSRFFYQRFVVFVGLILFSLVGFLVASIILDLAH